MTSAEVLRHLLAKRYAPPWATFAELGSGSPTPRTIDLYAMHTWPSKRFLRVAVEIKVSTSDWRRELDDPNKREPWERLANETWFAAPKGVIPPAEVPDGWGLLVVSDSGRTRAIRRARHRDVGLPPLHFLAGIARRAADPPLPPLEVMGLHGRKLRYSDLVRLAEKVGRKDHLWELEQFRKGEAKARQDRARRERYIAELEDVQCLVSDVLGLSVVTPRTIRAWLTSHRRVLPGQWDRTAVRDVYNRLGALLAPNGENNG